jgi:hypothetical protein
VYRFQRRLHVVRRGLLLQLRRLVQRRGERGGLLHGWRRIAVLQPGLLLFQRRVLSASHPLV